MISPIVLNPPRRRLPLIALFALCAVALADAPRPDDHIARALQLLRSLFPALGGTKAVIFDEATLGTQVNPDVMNLFSIKLIGSQDPAPLAALFRFDIKTHDLRDVEISGPFIDDRIDKMEKEVNEHPDWSDEEVVARLKAAGARFGPDDRDAFLRGIPLKQLEPTIGTLEVVDADIFPLRNEFADQPTATLRWIVDAKWHSADGKYEADARLAFEPFEGALQSFRMRSPRRATLAKP